jgi:cell division protein FtsL
MPGSGAVWSGRQLALLMILTLIVVLSAIGVVYSRFESRQLFVELQTFKKEKDELVIEWDRLQLEEGTVSTNGIIEKKARQQLNMLLPIYETVEHVGR